ncbi:hypothetical protein HMN09_01328400 [Mycena chlorophos]|uniref:Uncharacterized protein n=1 Tax=Mycena chlorophos TaxID=658473 RepID=A0A8H6RZQ2_MYCCL|nr:hypothetical protein HMN09_01328400 [Mycena chlorophos]
MFFHRRSSSKRHAPVPPNVVDLVIAHVATNPNLVQREATLLTCHRVARGWVQPARHHLFLEHPGLVIRADRPGNVQRAAALIRSPYCTLHNAVRGLAFVNGHKQDRISDEEIELFQDIVGPLKKVTTLAIAGPGWRMYKHFLDCTFRWCEQILELDIDKYSFRPDAFARFVTIFPNLRYLQLSGCTVDPNGPTRGGPQGVSERFPLSENTWDLCETMKDSMPKPHLATLSLDSPIMLPVLSWLVATNLTSLELYIPKYVRSRTYWHTLVDFVDKLEPSTLENFTLGLPSMFGYRTIPLPNLSRFKRLQLVQLRGIYFEHLDPMWTLLSTLDAPAVYRVLFEFRHTMSWTQFANAFRAHKAELRKLDAFLGDQRRFPKLMPVVFLMSRVATQLTFGPFPAGWREEVCLAFPELYRKARVIFQK